MNIYLKAILLAAVCATVPVRAAERELPKFESLSGLIRSNLAGVTDGELERAAAQGLLNHFKGRVVLVGGNGPAPAPKAGASPVGKQATYENAFGYVRILRVEPGLEGRFSAALGKLNAKKKLKGLVLDLRFASGLDYATAAKVADLFLAEEKPLLDWGMGTAKSTEKADPIKLPTMVLVNAQTRGAAEALAALLREARVALVLGGQTAGEANLFHEFTLEGGQRVRIASGKVKLGSGESFPADGVTPDIAVSVGTDEEKAFLTDPYKLAGNETAAAAAGSTNSPASTNSPRRRINEAELVRIQKEGRSLEDEQGATNAATAKVEAARPIVRDPALARALDLLKALAIVKAEK